jgi:hypothetical protein
MQMPWFTSKGQALTFLGSSIGAIIFIAGWLSIKPEHLLNGLPNSVLIVLIIAACVLAVLSAGAVLKFSVKQEALSPIQPAEPVLPQAAIPASPRSFFDLVPVVPAICVQRINCKVGGLWEGTLQDRTFKVVVHSVQKTDDGKDYEADIQVTQGTGGLEGGEDTRRVSSTRFWIPRSSRGIGSESKMLHAISVSPPYEVRIVALRADHINAVAQEVQLELCVIVGKPQLLGDWPQI